jgi:hypothetical protein
MSELFLVSGLSIFGGVCIFVLAFWMFRAINKSAPPAPQSSTNTFNDTALLFQTLRGIIHEQKVLAREFNRSVDKRIALVREITRAFNDERERLAVAQAELRALLERSAVAVRPKPEETPAPPTVENAAPALPAESEDIIDNWVGLSLAEDEETKQQEEEPAAPPETPEQREHARQAVNALLNPSEASKPAGIIHAFPEAHEEGAERLTSIRARAFDYQDAGMTVAQIAEALGVGKGEVRLMLNLREKAE